jgi:uncharacterized protein YggE
MKWWIAGASATADALAVGLLLTHGHGQAEARASSAAADEKKAERTITATGVSTVRVRPDAVRCTFGVKSTGDSFADVQAQNEKKAKKIADALTALKIEGLTIRTAPIDVQMQPAFGGPPFGIPGGPPGGPPGVGVPPGVPPGGPPAPPPGKENQSYTVTHSFSVEIQHADSDKLTALADKVLSTAISQGANTSAATDRNSPFGFGQGGPGESGTRVEFFKVDGNAERQKALKQAVAAAVANAKAAAGGADVTIKDVVNLTDQPNSAFGAMFGGPATRADPTGETDVTVSVSVTCTCN